ncbi:hypothetical protein GCM10009766_22900 [Microcella frigidaquae]
MVSSGQPCSPRVEENNVQAAMFPNEFNPTRPLIALSIRGDDSRRDQDKSRFRFLSLANTNYPRAERDRAPGPT